MHSSCPLLSAYFGLCCIKELWSWLMLLHKPSCPTLTPGGDFFFLKFCTGSSFFETTVDDLSYIKTDINSLLQQYKFETCNLPVILPKFYTPHHLITPTFSATPGTISSLSLLSTQMV